ncbi:hypothetical protein LEP1GSC158_1042 [Leptospira interrogans serovar Zanoni str. LT2156]|uniref:Uncharacterized protein n=1 Tax=Leptospira interrogans serovar Zanoni str. LT2156 TaxID=1001601 RepID=M6HD30_LEPIR|nr:hypothetical protein LEP1GSC158_1042 [Leptospira interrogans serovar Zanoni str. LT2156]
MTFRKLFLISLRRTHLKTKFLFIKLQKVKFDFRKRHKIVLFTKIEHI